VPHGPQFRPALDGDLAYRPGARAALSDGRSYLLASNESVGDPLPSVVEAIARAARQINRYPDNDCAELIRRIAGRYGLGEDSVVVGCGSVGVIQMVLEAVGETGTEVVYGWRSFEVYPVLANLAGMTSVRVPLENHVHDLPGMLAAITPRTRLVFVCNPNNPTGTTVDRPVLDRFMESVPSDCLVVLDEAYREYVTDPRVPDALTLLSHYPNLAVLRTFSKAYGLAGLRVGFMAAHPRVAEYVRRTYLPFTVNHIAQVAAMASLDAENELLARVRETTAERARVCSRLRALGWEVPPSQANFLWLSCGGQTESFARACAECGVNVRAFPGEGIRVSIGAPEDNDAFLAVAERVSPDVSE
jgi:histidinol-phosphate aminotransferase